MTHDRGRDGLDVERTGRTAAPVLESEWRYGRYPAAAALFPFVALELAHPRPAYPRTLGVAIALYSYWALAGMSVFGRDTWTRGGEGFAVAFHLLARIAPFAVRDGSIVVRWPFAGTTFLSIGGLAVFVAAVVVTYLAAVEGARRLAGAPAHSFSISCSHSSRSHSRTW